MGGPVTSLHRVDWSRLPPLVDDGGARHLEGIALPALALPATDGTAGDPIGTAGPDGRVRLSQDRPARRASP